MKDLAGLFYEDGAFKRRLGPGKHKLGRSWLGLIKRTVKRIDIRERSLTIKGQEILTADKVAIRVSLLVYFKATEPEAAAHNVANYEDRIYEDVQLAARRPREFSPLGVEAVHSHELRDAFSRGEPEVGQ